MRQTLLGFALVLGMAAVAVAAKAERSLLVDRVLTDGTHFELHLDNPDDAIASKLQHLVFVGTITMVDGAVIPTRITLNPGGLQQVAETFRQSSTTPAVVVSQIDGGLRLVMGGDQEDGTAREVRGGTSVVDRLTVTSNGAFQDLNLLIASPPGPAGSASGLTNTALGLSLVLDTAVRGVIPSFPLDFPGPGNVVTLMACGQQALLQCGRQCVESMEFNATDKSCKIRCKTTPACDPQ